MASRLRCVARVVARMSVVELSCCHGQGHRRLHPAAPQRLVPRECLRRDRSADGPADPAAEDRITNATSESLNRLAKLKARLAYGFRNPANQRRRVRGAGSNRAKIAVKAVLR